MISRTPKNMMTVSCAGKTSNSRHGLDAYRGHEFSSAGEPDNSFFPQSQHRDMQIIQEGINRVLIM